ncbi:MAG: hypothetical protein JWM04_5 [Verrucomicrobiales bacterium]|nr:hypothetical protein [Verrucomicrobiales bacterium]
MEMQQYSRAQIPFASFLSFQWKGKYEWAFNPLSTFIVMTLLKRIVTSIVLFVFFFVVAYIAICIVGGAINGAMAGAGNPNSQEATKLGRQAGADFVMHNLRMISWSSLVVSLVLSLGLSFSGILPWCRKPAQPPPL